MELRQLKYFVAVAEELHFSRAAEILNIAQPPLSQQIKKLEEELEVQLFNRSKRHVELTQTGKIFLQNTYKILAQVEDAEYEVREVHKGRKGVLKIGFTGSVTFDLLPTLIQSYRDAYPNVDVQLRQLTTSEQVVALNEDKIDVGLLVTPLNTETISVKELYKETFMAVIPENHPLVNHDLPITAHELAKYPLVIPSRKAGSVYNDSILSYFYKHNVSPKISQEVQELSTIIALVSFGMGIALLPSSMKNLHVPHVCYMHIKNSFSTTISIAHNKKSKSKLVKYFLKFVETLY